MIPSWLTDLDFYNAHFHANVWGIGELVHALKASEERLRLRAKEAYGTEWTVYNRRDNVAAFPPWGATEDEAQLRMALALGRLALGSALEAAFALQDLELSGEDSGELSGESSQEPSGESSGDPAQPRLYNDALLVAVWTSAHAEYTSNIQSGVEEPPHPSVHSIPNSLSEYDFGGLFAMRACPRLCPKTCLPLLQVFQRSLNTGARGWNSILESALQESVATRHVIVNAVIVGLLGMHPMIPPSKRAPWNERMTTYRALQHILLDSSVKATLILTASATKEAIRRMIATFLAASPALLEGLSVMNKSVLFLRGPPEVIPSKGLLRLSAALARAGLAVSKAVTSTRGQIVNADAYTAILNQEFRSSVQGTGSNGGDKRDKRDKGDKGVWDGSWLGKYVCNTNKTPCISVLADVWSSCFRVNFLAFWAHAITHKCRASRLDTSQHRALHSLNAVTKLVNALPEEAQLRAQRSALRHVSSGLITVNDAAVFLGIPPPPTQIKNVNDALRFLSSIGPEAAAEMFVFARTAWVLEEVLSVDLGTTTSNKQTSALLRRFRKPPRTLLADLPVQATHLHVCLECRRVSSAHLSEHSKPGTSFTELGTSSSMLCTVCTGVEKGESHILCAKRSSAALRTALTTGEMMTQTEVEQKEINFGRVEEILCEGKFGIASSTEDAGASGLAARIRRDAKTALEQRSRALACGEQRMLRVPIVGRAVRVFGDWYAICSLCGAMLRVLPIHRFGAEICCCKCDARLLGLPEPVVKETKNVVCRFCNAVDSERKSSRWKVVKAPLDVSGDNGNLPPYLRQVVYCPRHFRPWVASAHRVLQTKVILSHIAHNAKPIHSTAVHRTAEELGFEDTTKKKKRKKNSSGAGNSCGASSDPVGSSSGA